MNPALLPVVLVIVGCAVTAYRLRSERWGAAAACGLLGALLLAPALSRHDGVPSPAATLGLEAPWRSTADPALGNPIQSDVTFQVYPWLLFQRAELRAGRLPLWNPFQSSGTPYWSNGCGAPLYPLHLLFVVLPISLGFVVLPWLRILFAGLGAYSLARELGLSRLAALVPMVAFPLSGLFVGFLLFPMANALVLVPWILWATERVATTPKRWPALAVLTSLQLLAGHPETAAHTALLSGLYLLVRGTAVANWLRWAGGWLLGAALSAVQVLPFVFTVLASSRRHMIVDGAEPPLEVLLEQPLRLFLPQLFGQPVDGTWWGPFNYLATAVYVGAVMVPLAAAAVAVKAGDRRFRAVMVLVAFCFLAAYHMPVVRDIVNSLPVLGLAPEHRLIFGIELLLAMLAGAGLDALRQGTGVRGLVWGSAGVATFLAVAWWRFGDQLRDLGLATGQAAWTSWQLGIAIALTATALAKGRWRSWVLAAIPLVLVADLLAAHGRINPVQPLGQIYPELPSVDFLRQREGRIAATGGTLRPNAAMAYRLLDVRGDDTVKSAHYEQLMADHLGTGDPVYFRPLHRWQDPWLDLLGVRWVMTAPGENAPEPVWRLAYDGADARIFERPGGLPLVRFSDDIASRGALQIEQRRPGLWQIKFQSPQPAELVVAESWDVGWHAQLGDRELEVRPFRGHLLALTVPAGQGQLSLAYRPRGLVAGAILSAGALVILVSGLALGRRDRQ